MGLILNAAKSIGKEFLANKAADILGGSDKATPTETAQNDIPVDLSKITSMEDTYEPTVSDADENDPGIVEPENYELQPLENTNKDVPQEELDNLVDFFEVDDSPINLEQPLADDTPVTIDSNDSPSILNADSEPEVINQESTQGSTLPQESASVSGNTTIPESTALLSVPENDIDKQVEEAIESNPTVAEQVAEDVSGEDSPIETEAEQLNDSNPNNDEVADESIEQTPIKEKQEILDKLNSAGSSFINVPSSINWDKVKVYEPGEDAEGYGIEKDSYDPRVEAINEYDYETEVGDPGVLLHRDEDFLGQDEWVDEEGNIHDYSELANGNTEALNKEWYEGDESGEGEYSESGNVNLDYEAAELQDQIKEAEALPVTNAEEAKEKQNKLKALRLKLKEVQTATGSGSNVSSKGPTTDNGTQTTGGRVSPRAGIGSIGGGASGHGSMSSTRPTKNGDNHNSIASKAPLSQALEDNQGRVVSVNGKATTAPSSNNNGAFRSGSFGLMSKAKSNLKSIPSKAPVSGGAEHKGQNMMATNMDVNLEDGKQILIERLKQLLTQLTDEEKKQMGFSAASNQWNGKALSKLDGYTLQDLIDKVEKYLGEK